MRSLKAELAELRAEMQPKNIELGRLHHELVQMKQLIRSVEKTNILANYFVDATVAIWKD